MAYAVPTFFCGERIASKAHKVVKVAKIKASVENMLFILTEKLKCETNDTFNRLLNSCVVKWADQFLHWQFDLLLTTPTSTVPLFNLAMLSYHTIADPYVLLSIRDLDVVCLSFSMFKYSKARTDWMLSGIEQFVVSYEQSLWLGDLECSLAGHNILTLPEECALILLLKCALSSLRTIKGARAFNRKIYLPCKNKSQAGFVNTIHLRSSVAQDFVIWLADTSCPLHPGLVKFPKTPQLDIQELAAIGNKIFVETDNAPYPWVSTRNLPSQPGLLLVRLQTHPSGLVGCDLFIHVAIALIVCYSHTLSAVAPLSASHHGVSNPCATVLQPCKHTLGSAQDLEHSPHLQPLAEVQYVELCIDLKSLDQDKALDHQIMNLVNCAGYKLCWSPKHDAYWAVKQHWVKEYTDFYSASSAVLLTASINIAKGPAHCTLLAIWAAPHVLCVCQDLFCIADDNVWIQEYQMLLALPTSIANDAYNSTYPLLMVTGLILPPEIMGSLSSTPTSMSFHPPSLYSALSTIGTVITTKSGTLTQRVYQKVCTSIAAVALDLTFWDQWVTTGFEVDADIVGNNNYSDDDDDNQNNNHNYNDIDDANLRPFCSVDINMLKQHLPHK
ncbi:hypothetical protein B0H13DRAFT_1909969 [Mycena leptocephala]|nr:hypothetical protein B0H13DRAFT_1909969 [Mycena leptocephala]